MNTHDQMKNRLSPINQCIKCVGFALLIVFIILPDGKAALSAVDSRALFDQGMEAFSSGNYGSAELLLRKIVESGDQEYLDRAWFFMARSIFNKKKYDSALFEFKSFLNKCRTDDLAVESRYWMGESYYNIQDYANAIEELRRYITRTEKSDLVPLAHDRIGSIYFTQKRYDEAVIEWEAASAKSADRQNNAARQYRIGEALFMNGRLEEAIKHLVPLTGQQEDARSNAKTYLLLGRIYQKKGEHQKALQMFNALPAYLTGEEQFSETQYFKARSCEKLGQTAQARILLESYSASGKKSRWYYHAQYRLGRLLLRSQDKDEGIRILDQVRAESGAASLSTSASVALGDFYAATNPEKAISYLGEAIKTARPRTKNRLMVLLGKTYLRVKKYDRSADIFTLYLKENPFDKDRDEINFLRARAYLEMGEIEKANEIFNTIRKENPFSKFNSESNYYIALVHSKKGDDARAIALLREYIARKNAEQSYDAHLLLLQIYLKRDDIESAGRIADVLSRIYVSRKDVEITLYEYTLALMKKGHDARRYINLILNRFSGSETAAELSFSLGNDNFNRGNFAYAIVYYDKYLNSTYTRNSGTAYYRKIVSLSNLKRYDDLINCITKGQFPPMNELQWKEIPLLQARSYYQLKKYDEVYMTLDIRNIRDYPKEDILMYLKCALRVGDYRSAIEANDFLESDRNIHAESLYLIGEHLLRKEKKEEADLFFTKIINECPGTRYVGNAKLSLSEMYIMNKKFQDALHYISDVDAAADRDLQNRKNSLLIRCHFEMGMTDKAVAYAEEHLSELLGSEHGEQVMKSMLWHYYKKKDLQQFDRYAKFLRRYPGNEPLVTCLSGRINLQAGNYRAAYNYFLVLSQLKSIYINEAWYHLGMHALLASANPMGALGYFKRITDAEDGNTTLMRKALVQSAIIYHEMKNNEKTKECLEKVLATARQGLAVMQARNLYEEFGYGIK
jgi:tetratricopeptide (TPR) repeat protein